MFALIDCNNFYASCERLFRPDLRNVAVAVLSNNDGCIIARSQEVKDLGIKMGEPYFKIRDVLKRHNVQVFSSNYELYADISARVMETLRQFSPDVEVYSIDECFLGLRGFAHKDLLEYGYEMKHIVHKWTGIPVGVGIAPTKTLAKVANKLAKQCQGVCLLDDAQRIETALSQFPVEDLWGIGRQYTKFLAGQGVYTAAQLRQQPDSWIRKHLTVGGLRTVYELRGISCIPLEDMPAPQKALAVTRSFARPITEWPEMNQAICHYITRAGEKLRAKGLAARHIQVFLHTSPHSTGPYYSKAAQRQMPQHTNYTPELVLHGRELLKGVFRTGFRFVKCGVILSDLIDQNVPCEDLFYAPDHAKRERLMNALDEVNRVNGKHTLFFAGAGIKPAWSMNRSILSPCYTTKWSDIPYANI